MPKKPAKKSKGRNGGMATFIRSIDRKVPAKEVVARGVKKGMKIPLQYVYAVRSYKPAGKLRRPALPLVRWPEETLEGILARHAQELRNFILSRL